MVSLLTLCKWAFGFDCVSTTGVYVFFYVHKIHLIQIEPFYSFLSFSPKSVFFFFFG